MKTVYTGIKVIAALFSDPDVTAAMGAIENPYLAGNAVLACVCGPVNIYITWENLRKLYAMRRSEAGAPDLKAKTDNFVAAEWDDSETYKSAKAIVVPHLLKFLGAFAKDEEVLAIACEQISQITTGHQIRLSWALSKGAAGADPKQLEDISVSSAFSVSRLASLLGRDELIETIGCRELASIKGGLMEGLLGLVPRASTSDTGGITFDSIEQAVEGLHAVRLLGPVAVRNALSAPEPAPQPPLMRGGFMTFDKGGKPRLVGGTQEQSRGLQRMEMAIDAALKEMGHAGGYAKLDEFMKVASKDMGKLTEFLRRRDEHLKDQ